jgi:hypothetical protein
MVHLYLLLVLMKVEFSNDTELKDLENDLFEHILERKIRREDGLLQLESSTISMNLITIFLIMSVVLTKIWMKY